MTDLNQIAKELVDVVVDAVHLQHIDKNDIKLDTPLTQGGLELDSIDILEIVVAVEQHFGVKVTNAETGKKHFSTIGSIAQFIFSENGRN